MDEQPREHGPILIGRDQLSAEAVANLIEEFILREGTDYGAREAAHREKVAQVESQLMSGEVRIVFDPNTETATLLTRRDLQRLARTWPDLHSFETT